MTRGWRKQRRPPPPGCKPRSEEEIRRVGMIRSVAAQRPRPVSLPKLKFLEDEDDNDNG